MCGVKEEDGRIPRLQPWQLSDVMSGGGAPSRPSCLTNQVVMHSYKLLGLRNRAWTDHLWLNFG